MADKDFGRGWGDLNGSLTMWRCPRCKQDYSVNDWAIVSGQVNGYTLEGRKCPKCDFQAFQHGETREMIPK